jgi:hypothetical protein
VWLWQRNGKDLVEKGASDCGSVNVELGDDALLSFFCADDIAFAAGSSPN